MSEIPANIISAIALILLQILGSEKARYEFTKMISSSFILCVFFLFIKFMKLS